MSEPTRQDWHSWATNSVTKNFQERLKLELFEIKDAWAYGNFTSQSCDQTVQINAKQIGKCEAIKDILVFIETAKEVE